MTRLSPIQAVRALAKLRGLKPRDARKVFRAEVLSGKHSPQGIRFKYEGRVVDVRRKNRGGWTYVAGIDAEIGEWVPVRGPPDYEPIPPGFLVLASEEDGFDDKAATITAGRLQYRHVAYVLDDAAGTDAAPSIQLQLPAARDNHPIMTERTDERVRLLQAAWIKLGRPEQAAAKVWQRAQADNPDKVSLFQKVASPRHRRRIVAAAVKDALLQDE
jgi:hypothetical protein